MSFPDICGEEPIGYPVLIPCPVEIGQDRIPSGRILEMSVWSLRFQDAPLIPIPASRASSAIVLVVWNGDVSVDDELVPACSGLTPRAILLPSQDVSIGGASDAHAVLVSYATHERDPVLPADLPGLDFHGIIPLGQERTGCEGTVLKSYKVDGEPSVCFATWPAASLVLFDEMSPKILVRDAPDGATRTIEGDEFSFVVLKANTFVGFERRDNGTDNVVAFLDFDEPNDGGVEGGCGHRCYVW